MYLPSLLTADSVAEDSFLPGLLVLGGLLLFGGGLLVLIRLRWRALLGVRFQPEDPGPPPVLAQWRDDGATYFYGECEQDLGWLTPPRGKLVKYGWRASIRRRSDGVRHLVIQGRQPRISGSFPVLFEDLESTIELLEGVLRESSSTSLPHAAHHLTAPGKRSRIMGKMLTPKVLSGISTLTIPLSKPDRLCRSCERLLSLTP